MPQLHFSVDRDTAAAITRQAAEAHVSLSQYLAGVMKRELRGAWPEAYLSEVVGSCASDPLHEPDELVLDDTDLNDASLDASGLDGSGR